MATKAMASWLGLLSFVVHDLGSAIGGGQHLSCRGGSSSKQFPWLLDVCIGSVGFPCVQGDAFMFWSIHPDGKKEDSKSLHTGCPVLQGVKWTATKWLHGRPFRRKPSNLILSGALLHMP